MKLTIPRNGLLRTITPLMSVMEKSPIPILTHFKFEADEQLQITATNLEVTLQAKIDTMITQKGACTVSAKKLFDIVKALPDQPGAPVHIHAQDGKVTIKCASSRFSLPTMDVNNYPVLLLPKPEDCFTYTIPTNEFISALQAGSSCMSKAAGRVAFDATKLEITSDAIRCVSTDGHRLMLAITPFSTDTPTSLLIPRKVVEMLLRLDIAGGSISLTPTPNIVLIAAENLLVTFRPIAEKFPDYSTLVQVDGTSVRARVGDMRTALNQMALVDEKVIWSFPENACQFTAQSEAVGDAETKIDNLADPNSLIYSNLDKISIQLNTRYLIELIAAMNSSEVEFRIKDEFRQVLAENVRSEGDKLVLIGLVMPMHKPASPIKHS